MRMIVALTVAFTSLFFVGVAAATTTPQQRLNAASSWVAGHPVTVQCSKLQWHAAADPIGYDGEDGFTYIGTPITYVRPYLCAALDKGWTEMQDGEDYVDAVLTVTHEAVHQRGISNESITECTAYHMALTVAIKFFHLPAHNAQAISYFISTLQTIQENLPASYQCA